MKICSKFQFHIGVVWCLEKLKEKKILSESLSKSQVSLNSLPLSNALSLASEGVAFVCCSVAVSGCNIPKEPLITMSALLKVIIYVCIKYICIYIYLAKPRSWDENQVMFYYLSQKKINFLWRMLACKM